MSEYGMLDSELIEEHGIPAGADINEFMIEQVYKDNIAEETKAKIESGMESDQAFKEAKAFADKSKVAAYKSLEKVKSARGY